MTAATTLEPEAVPIDAGDGLCHETCPDCWPAGWARAVAVCGVELEVGRGDGHVCPDDLSCGHLLCVVCAEAVMCPVCGCEFAPSY